MKINVLLTVATIGLTVASAQASTINYLQSVGTPYETPGLSTYNTYGNDMAGMDAWVTFSDGETQHAVWAVTGATSGAATVGGFFTISETGDTFNNLAWTLQNLSTTLSITSFTLLGAGGDTVFDRTFGGATGTPNSASGKDFYINGSYSVTATYTDELNLTGAAAVGDEFTEIEVAFGANTYFGPGGRVNFTQDTDNAAVHGTITPSVPDGASTAMMLGMGILAIGALKKRLS
jgi:hypothetical protein